MKVGFSEDAEKIAVGYDGERTIKLFSLSKREELFEIKTETTGKNTSIQL